MRINKLIRKSIDLMNILVLIYFTGALRMFLNGLIDRRLEKVYIIVSIISMIFVIFKFLNNRIEFSKRNFLLVLFSSSIIALSLFNNYKLLEPIKLLLTSFYVIYLVEYYTFDRLIKLLFNLTVVTIVATILIIVIAPETGRMYYDGQIVLKGGFYHKNSLGAFLVYSYIIQTIYLINNKKNFKKIFLFLIITMDIFLLLGTASTTSYLSILIITGILIIYKYTNIKFPLGSLLMLMHLVSYYLVFYGAKYNEIFMRIFNKDLSFTGRKLIWQVVLELIEYKKYIGYGYGNIWGGSYVKDYIIYNTFEGALGPHNGILDWLLECGLIGLIGILLMITIFFVNLSKIRKTRTNEVIFSAMYITFFLIFYISERASQPDSLIFIGFMICFALMNKKVKQYKLLNKKIK